MSGAEASSPVSGRAPKGVLCIDKPEGPTSHDAVGAARRALGERRIGHTGTLDPFATGLLILLVGPATRLADSLSPLPKRYAATVKLGEETDTADRTGAVVRTAEGATSVTRIQVEEALRQQVGTVSQLPPRYSAKKVGGEPAHRRMRRGEQVELAPAEVSIHSIDITRFEPPLLDLDVLCSTGTYIRAIARDLGEALGLGGHLTALRRTEIGPYRVADAASWSDLSDPELARASLTATAQAFTHLPRLALSDEDLELIRTGRRVAAPELEESDGAVLATHQGLVASIGEVRAGQFHPKKVFPDGA